MKVFVNAYLENNLGDDLFFEILKNRYKGNKFYVMSSSVEKEKDVVVYKNKFFNKIIQKFELKKLLANKCDIIVSIGGSIYMEPKNNANKKFFLGNKPYYVLGSNFGPYYTDTYYKNAHKFFEGAEDVCFRDKYSHNLFSDIPVVRHAPDIIFSLNTGELGKMANTKKATFSIISCKDKLDVKYEEKYIEAITDMTKELISKGYEITYMSFCKNENDELAIEQILEKLDSNTKEKIEKYYYRGNIKEALNVLNNSDIIVGTRFHATILGILLNKAVIPIIYSDKTKHTLEDLKFEGKTVDIRQLDKYNVKELLSEENISYRLDIEKVRKEAETQFSKLDEVLKKEQK
jgi:colanic acid/amylovoran biosynthesis protein